jgi:CheY-like chemotaxis protein
MRAILLVEDDEALRSALTQTLALDGFEVLAAPDGTQALRLLAQRTPDLVITDVNMPGVGGLPLAAALSTYPRFVHIPVLLISGDPDAPVPPHVPFLAKPFSLETFLEAVRALADGLPPG